MNEENTIIEIKNSLAKLDTRLNMQTGELEESWVENFQATAAAKKYVCALCPHETYSLAKKRRLTLKKQFVNSKRQNCI